MYFSWKLVLKYCWKQYWKWKQTISFTPFQFFFFCWISYIMSNKCEVRTVAVFCGAVGGMPSIVRNRWITMLKVLNYIAVMHIWCKQSQTCEFCDSWYILIDLSQSNNSITCHELSNPSLNYFNKLYRNWWKSNYSLFVKEKLLNRKQIFFRPHWIFYSWESANNAENPYTTKSTMPLHVIKRHCFLLVPCRLWDNATLQSDLSAHPLSIRPLLIPLKNGTPPPLFKFPLSCNAYLFGFRGNKNIVSMTLCLLVK